MLCARTEMLDPTTVWTMTLLYALGGTLRHNAGCCWNDICDVDFDRQVGEYQVLNQDLTHGTVLTSLDGLTERSKSRPLASGAISMTGAFALFAAHYVALYYLLTLTGDEGYVILLNELQDIILNIGQFQSWSCGTVHH